MCGRSKSANAANAEHHALGTYQIGPSCHWSTQTLCRKMPDVKLGFCHWIVHGCFPECSSTQGQQRVSKALSISQVFFKCTQLLNLSTSICIVGQLASIPTVPVFELSGFLDKENWAQHISSVLTSISVDEHERVCSPYYRSQTLDAPLCSMAA